MSTQNVLPFTRDRVQAHRDTKRGQIERYFSQHLGELVSSRAIHMRYGSSARTRISEINRDPNAPITIKNEVCFTEGREQSSYFSVRR